MEKLKIIALGGAGVKIVNNYIENYKNINTVVISPNINDINFYKCTTKILVGDNITNGLGCSANPEIGKKAVLISKNKIEKVVKNTETVILVAGLGGGTGTGEITEIAKITKELKIKTIAIVTFPFLFEGKKRINVAKNCIEELQNNVEELIVVKNEELLQQKSTNSNSFINALEISDKETAKKIKEVIDKEVDL